MAVSCRYGRTPVRPNQALSEERSAPEASEHSFVLELGPAAEWPLQGERPNYGGNIAIETEPIENWLELEAGLSGFGTGSRALSVDLLFKKPFRLSSSIELMVGVGPEVTQTFGKGTTASAEFALDFMFWPQKNLGWFVEPAFDIDPGNGRKSLGATAGLIVGFP